MNLKELSSFQSLPSKLLALIVEGLESDSLLQRRERKKLKTGDGSKNSIPCLKEMFERSLSYTGES